MQHSKNDADISYMTQHHEDGGGGTTTSAIPAVKVGVIRGVGHGGFGHRPHSDAGVGRLGVPEPTRPRAAYPHFGCSCRPP